MVSSFEELRALITVCMSIVTTFLVETCLYFHTDCCAGFVLRQHPSWGITLSSLNWDWCAVVLMLWEHLNWLRHWVASRCWTWVWTLLTYSVLDTLVSWVLGSGVMGSLVTSDSVSVLHSTDVDRTMLLFLGTVDPSSCASSTASAVVLILLLRNTHMWSSTNEWNWIVALTPLHPNDPSSVCVLDNFLPLRSSHCYFVNATQSFHSAILICQYWNVHFCWMWHLRILVDP